MTTAKPEDCRRRGRGVLVLVALHILVAQAAAASFCRGIRQSPGAARTSHDDTWLSRRTRQGWWQSTSTVIAAKGDDCWQVFVDQSRPSLDKGAAATLDAFLALAPKNDVVVNPAVLPKSKAKSPVVRCVSNNKSMDVGNVDSVDKVYRILTKHMQVQGVSSSLCDCLKWKYRGNGHLEAYDDKSETASLSLAIDAYDKALETGETSQTGTILLMRATAHLQRADAHKQELKRNVNDLIAKVPEASSIESLYEQVSEHPALANAAFRRVLQDAKSQETQFRVTQYRHGLYQYALLQAAQDALKATQLLPQYARSWLAAGEILSELWKLKESMQYYETAMELDESLRESVLPVMERLDKRQALLDNARAYGWSEDTLRLALDVAG